MAINRLSVGRQLTLTIATPTVGEISIANVTDFTYSFDPVNRKSVTMTGNVLFAVLPQGGRGEVMFQRTSPEIEQYWTSYEAEYYNGQNLNSSTITAIILEADGGITEYIFTGVMFDNPELGRWSGNDIITQRLSFSFSRMETQI